MKAHCSHLNAIRLDTKNSKKYNEMIDEQQLQKENDRNHPIVFIGTINPNMKSELRFKHLTIIKNSRKVVFFSRFIDSHDQVAMT